MKIRDVKRAAAIALAAFCLPALQAETVLFQDNFDTDNSANWNVIDSSANGVPDFTVDWAFDYSKTSYTSNGVAFNIPPAPSGNGSTGVKVTVNKNDDVASEAAVNLYPKDKSFGGNYALRFDMWINYNGGEYGGSGSTEFAIFGLNHTGTQPNWAAPADVLTTSDGVWFAVTGEAGAARDYRSYEGDPVGAPLAYTGPDGGFLDRDGNGTVEEEVVDVDADGADYPLNLIFPRPPGETTGVPGKQWVTVEVRQRDSVITWLMNGYVIAEKQNFSGWDEGDIMIGTMDIFASVANPKADNFVLFDNLRVVDLGTDEALPRLTLEATNPTAAEPGTSGTVTITRTGDSSKAINVRLAVGGTATAGQDYVTLPASTNMGAGVTSLEIPITVIDDPRAESPETVRVSLVSGPGEYEVFAPMVGTVEIADDADVTAVSVSAADAFAYENIASDTAAFRISRVGDTSIDQTVNFSISGTAVSGTDYTALGTSATIPAGEDSTLVKVVPVKNSASLGDSTVQLTLASGTGYVLGASTNATVTIRNGDAPSGTVVFSDNFDSDTGPNWAVNEANPDSNIATFNYDYSQVGIPPAPHSTNGTTLGLRLQANTGATAVFTGLSVSPLNQGFTGDYQLLFDMWVNYNGPLAAGGAGSTLSFSAGVGTAGDVAQFPGTSVDGVLFSVTGDGGSGSDWRAYTAIGAPLDPATGAYAAGTQSGARNNTDPYYAPFGGVTAPEAQVANYPDQTGVSSIGAPGEAWHEVAIVKRGTNVTWFVDNLRIATIDLTNKEISTNIFVGFFDINAGQTGNQEMSFGLVDNLRVEQLERTEPGATIEVSGIQHSGDNVVIGFTTTGSATGIVVESSENVAGGYAPETAAQIETVSSTGGTTVLRATVPISTPVRFFRIRQ